MKIRPAREADAEPIVRLIHQGFDAAILKAMIYGCPGMVSYVRRCISIPEGLADTFYAVAEEAGHIVGCVELRFMGKILFLNYICTSAGMRGKGLGRELLRNAVEMTGPSSYDGMRLDVFNDNAAARAWYEKLGFTGEYGTIWWSIPLSARNCPETGRFSGLAQADLCQREFGFSQFSLSTATASYSVGRLGRDWFRVCQEGLLADDQALAALDRLEPGRNILGIFEERSSPELPGGAKPLLGSQRMTIGLDLLMHNLKD